MHAFWLVLTYDLLEDRCIDDVIIKTFLNSLLSKTNRTSFHTFGTVIRPENFLTEFVLMEKSEG